MNMSPSGVWEDRAALDHGSEGWSQIMGLLQDLQLDLCW